MAVEHASTVDTANEAEKFLRQHPEHMDDFRRWIEYIGSHNHVDHVVRIYTKTKSLLATNGGARNFHFGVSQWDPGAMTRYGVWRSKSVRS